jgi:hypothetical protein
LQRHHQRPSGCYIILYKQEKPAVDRLHFRSE